jgi:glycerol-3-phosphate dehydrogenase
MYDPSMQRHLTRLADSCYDVLVIGGGIYGACVAREGVLRGLSVALVDMADFASGTSANSLKVIHGGLRYLQHGDLPRMRISINERHTLMRIAPHLVHPLPVLIPTYGHGVQGKEIFRLALMLNDVVSFDRNRGLDAQHALPRGRVLTKSACLHLAPGLRRGRLTGGAFFYDAQVHNSERLLLASLRSAAQAGAAVANYTKVIGFLTQQDRVVGARVQDVLGGEQFDIRARMIVNTTGPWVNQCLRLLPRSLPVASVRHAQAMNLITRSLDLPCALGVQSWQDYRDTDTLINKGSRFLFITPWRGHSLIGTAYTLAASETEGLQIPPQDIAHFLTDINGAYPAAQLRPQDVSFVHGGFVPIAGTHPVTGDIQLAKHHQIRDHRQDGWHGLLSVVGVKYTTARYVAEQVIDQIFAAWGQRPGRSSSATTPLYGGGMERYSDFLRTEIQRRPQGLTEDMVRHLVSNYGTAYTEVLQYRHEHRSAEGWAAIRSAEVLYGIEHEMAQKLSDIVLRRTDLGTAGHPGGGCLWDCAKVMGSRLGWDQVRMQQEVDEVSTIFPAYMEQCHHAEPRVADTAVQ